MARNSRRDVLRRLGALGALGLAAPMGGLRWAEASGGGSGGYKALVCLFLQGGNDSWNTVVPDSPAEHRAYFAARGGSNTWGLGVPRDQLLSLPLDAHAPDDRRYGLHPALGGLQKLYSDSMLAIVPNVGPMILPTTPEQYRNAADLGHRLPPQLFSHNDQERQWETLRGDQLLRTGWAGRVADRLAAQHPGSAFPMNISLMGQTVLQAGELDGPYAMAPTGASEIDGLFSGGMHERRRAAVSAIFQDTVDASDSSLYARVYADKRLRMIEYAQLTNSLFDKAPALPRLPDTLPPTEPLKIQLRTVAKLIAMRDEVGAGRQIFAVTHGGHDTHGQQNRDQTALMSELGGAISAFTETMVDLGLSEQVTLFTTSDFGRTLTSNGDGSDHGWGGLQLVAGGGVIGGRMHGHYPLLDLDTEDDIGGGVFVPEVSVDQYVATLARWFGVAEADLDTVTPNLRNFALHDLGFLV